MAQLTRFLCLGNLTIDDTVMPDGRTAMASPGGNTLYAAIGARVWTDDVAMVTRKGEGYPPEILDALHRAGYETDGLVPSPLPRIRQWQLYDVEGGRTYVRLASSPNYAEATPAPGEIPGHLASGAVACHVCPVPVPVQEPLIRWSRERGLLTTVDPHHEWVRGREAEWRRILPLVDVFLPSREEAKELLGGWPGPLAAARALAGWGARLVCLKLGADGALVYDAVTERSWRIPTVTQAPVDTTGCGDAFCGGFLVGWTEAGDPVTGARYGTVSASFVAAGFGAGHALVPDRPEGQRRLAALAAWEGEG